MHKSKLNDLEQICSYSVDTVLMVELKSNENYVFAEKMELNMLISPYHISLTAMGLSVV